MKRKHGNKKGKTKKLPLVVEEKGVITLNNEEEDESDKSETSSSSDDEDNDADDDEVVKDDEEERITRTQTLTPVSTTSESKTSGGNNVIVRPPPTVVYGRVKVKLKTSNSKPLVDTRSQKEEGVVDEKEKEKKEKEEVNVVSMPESKKSGGIKIVSLKGLSPSKGKESGGSGSSPEEKREGDEDRVAHLRGDVSRFDKHELEASLEVIRKVMKMDAAEPFNVPVNPVELGIPDYFDVIDTPMDFGTVHKNLESGAKYMNSKDVYKDVQYIWENCYKYNNKGDYIVDLMKRVKKNFMKYWMAAGLYTEQSKKTYGGESNAMDEATTSGNGKKVKRGKGVKRHKDGCMCAICIMKRRRREREAREAREAGVQIFSPKLEVTMMDLQECKQEENSHADSPHGEDTSSYMETSQDVDADAEMEDVEEVRLAGVALQYDDGQKVEDDRGEFRDRSDRSGDISEKSQRSDKGETETYSHVERKVHDESGVIMKTNAQKQLSAQPETSGYLRQRHELLELEKKRQRFRLIETFRDLENPMLLSLCGTLFPNNCLSVWNGANSLARCQRSSSHRRDIHEAVASFMTPCKSSSSRK